ncbi:MAG: PKD domain-containing protein [Flavobacteriales bacterium]
MKYSALYLHLLTALLAVLLLGYSTQVKATHIVGGDMYYTYLGAAGYEITLTVFRDCGPDNVNQTPFDADAQIGIYDNATGDLYTSFSMDLFSAEVDFVPVELENPCFILPPDVCVERARYTETINLPFNTAGYTIVYVRCCRNSSIVNLDSPQDQGISIFTTIPGTALVDEENNSAQFTNFPPVALCANAAFYFDASATDGDGDSLVYSFCDPMLGATPDDPAPPPSFNLNLNPVDWAAGFSSSYPIASNPAFAIDAVTGEVTGTATEIGRYAIGICVSEYRDGVLINSIMRDFQFNVTICDPNIVSAIPPQEDFCAGAELQFENNSINATSYHWDFGVAGIESDTSNLETPSYIFPDAGVFTVTLVANPGWPCADTSESVFSTFPPMDPEIIVDNYQCLNNLDYYDLQVEATTEGNALYEWELSPGTIPQFATGETVEGVQLNPEALSTTVTVTVTENGCEETTSTTIENPADPVAIITPQEAFCDGMNYSFGNESLDATSYNWDFGLPGTNDTSNDFQPNYTFPDTGFYQVTLIALSDFTCSDTAYLDFEIYGLLDPEFPEQEPQCFEGNSFDFVAQGATTNAAIYTWDFGPFASTSSTSQPNPQNISYDAPGWYDVELTIAENGCVETFLDSVWVVANFEIEFDVDPKSGCPPVSTSFSGYSVADVPVYYTWDFGDGFTSATQNTTHLYSQPGVYDVTVTAYTTGGCIESTSAFYPGVVVVHFPPIAGFSIEPQILDILNPEVTVTDLSSGSIECYYSTSDGGESNFCDFNYTFTEAGIQSITQIVTNEYGCVATATGEVIINGFLFFAPNAFTPNNDGLNDFWLPESTGISSYDLKIFNRWGDVIFETDNPAMAWTGSVHNGEYFAQDGVYNYIVRAEDLVGLPHEFVGHIVLTR